MDEKEAEKKTFEKLKAKRASETEEQRKERLRIRREKDRRTKKATRGKDKVVSNKDHVEQRLATLKRLKRGDEKL